MDPRAVLAISALLIGVFVAVDLRDAGFRASWWRDRARLKRNAAFLVANLATMTALHAVTDALHHALPRWVTWRGPRVIEVVACLVVAELVNWISHRVKHKNARLWRFHTQHHVETLYNVNLTLHTHGLEVVVSGAAMGAVLTLLGFSQFSVDVFALSYFGANLYKHCTARLSLGPLDFIVVSPAYHRLHHARDHEGNYGSVLTLFDVLFGTATFPTMQDAFARELGTKDEEPFGFVAEMLSPFRGLGRARQRDGQLAGGAHAVADGERGGALALVAPPEGAHVGVE